MDGRRWAASGVFTRVSASEAAVAEAERVYRGEIEAILDQLHALLPRYWQRVDPCRYAYDRDELLALSAACRYDMLTLPALEALLADAKKHHRVFAEVLGQAPSVRPYPSS